MRVTKQCTCSNCGRDFLNYNTGEWLYRRRDYRKTSETYQKILWFCSNRCMNEYEKTYPSRKYSRGFKNG